MFIIIVWTWKPKIFTFNSLIKYLYIIFILGKFATVIKAKTIQHRQNGWNANFGTGEDNLHHHWGRRHDGKSYHYPLRILLSLRYGVSKDVRGRFFSAAICGLQDCTRDKTCPR